MQEQYGSQDMLHDLETLATAGAYRSTPIEALLHAAESISRDPQTYEESQMTTPTDRQRTDKFLELMAPLVREIASETIKEAVSRKVQSSVEKAETRDTKVRDHYGISRDQWAAMTPWERSYYDQDFDYTD